MYILAKAHKKKKKRKIKKWTYEANKAKEYLLSVVMQSLGNWMLKIDYIFLCRANCNVAVGSSCEFAISPICPSNIKLGKKTL